MSKIIKFKNCSLVVPSYDRLPGGAEWRVCERAPRPQLRSGGCLGAAHRRPLRRQLRLVRLQLLNERIRRPERVPFGLDQLRSLHEGQTLPVQAELTVLWCVARAAARARVREWRTRVFMRKASTNAADREMDA